MRLTPTRFAARTIALVLALMLLSPLLPSQDQTGYVFHAESDLVLANVTVRDKSGKFVTGLKPENFTILEDNKPQKIVSFDVENVDAVATTNVAQAKPLPETSFGATNPAASAKDATDQFKDRRLI
ncbi:MAG: hypothetical protein WBW01_07150, partial [Terriglobales bacterium]